MGSCIDSAKVGSWTIGQVQARNPHIHGSNCVKFLDKSGLSYIKMTRKKSKFNMQALTRLQNHLNQVRFVGRYQRKGPFLKTVLMILKPNKVDWIIFLTFSGHSDLGLPTPVKKFEIWLNLSQGCVGLVFCVIQYLVYLNKSIVWIVWIRDVRWTQSNSTQPNPHYPIFHPFFLQSSIRLGIGWGRKFESKS